MQVIHGDELQAKRIPRTPCVIEGVLPVGYTLLSAPRKIGKSWIALQMCLAVASGGEFLGRKALKGQALYIALEDNEGSSSARMADQIGDEPCPHDMMYCFGCKGIEDGFIEELDGLISSEGLTELKIVAIDVLALIDGTIRRGEDVYHKDYRVGSTLKKWAEAHGVAVVAVTHVSKRKSDDLFDDTMGTGGVTGSADNLIAIRKSGKHRAVMSVIGRYLPEIDIDMVFRDCKWHEDRQGFEVDPIYAAVEKAAGTDEKWTASRLKTEYGLKADVREIGEYLTGNKDLLFDKGYEVKAVSNGTGAKYYKIRRV